MAIDFGQKGGKFGRPRPNMNVTPLVDVVLVLLIIFMVITPLLAKQFWIDLPNKVEKEPPRDTPDKVGRSWSA
jgi:biopolymer transport protein ExbD/biopolymer transport protein TolR